MAKSVGEIKALLKDQDFIEASMPQGMEIESLLAEGGQGVIYRGHKGGITAAVKIYFPGQVQKRIQREVDALGSLDCPNIVKLIWAGEIEVEDHGLLQAVATELAPGTALNQALKKQPLSLEELGILAYDIANAIAAMWDKRIVHRDLKPSNVVVSPEGRVCVIDLGLARYVDRSSLTPFGMSWGTHGYLSPEQTKAQRQLTCKSDIFSLAVTLLEASLGKHPTHGDQLVLLASGFEESLPTALEDWEFAPLVQRMLNPRPIVRPMPSEILGQLEQFRPKDEKVKGE